MEENNVVNTAVNTNIGQIIDETYDRLINLSFGDVKISRMNDKTIVSMISYFRADKLCKFMNQLGYTNMPDIVTNTLQKYGYTYNYKLGGYSTKTTGIVTLDPRDADEQVKANNMAMTKAKVKAYDRATRCLETIKVIFYDTMALFDDSAYEISKLYVDETDALNRVIETGYCNPDKQ